MTDIKACKQLGCEIKKDGKCLEGLETEECPHFYWGEDSVNEETIEIEKSSVINKVSSKINVFPGTELSINEITLITHRYPCDLVIVLGDLDCGKTTLLATIFDLFQIGNLKKYLFAGSLTQKGFEIRSHLSRMLSGGIKPDTERTKTLEFRILHIAIKSIETSLVKHFLLSDISGETIKLARSSGSAMKEQLAMAKIANHIIYIIDGEKLGSKKAATILDAELFIQSALDNKIFGKDTILNILISKWDLLEKVKTFNMEDNVIKKINNRFQEKLKRINFKKIASRPIENATSDIDLGFGVEDLINDFMKLPPTQKNLTLQTNTSERFIENYKIKNNG